MTSYLESFYSVTQNISYVFEKITISNEITIVLILVNGIVSTLYTLINLYFVILI